MTDQVQKDTKRKQNLEINADYPVESILNAYNRLKHFIENKNTQSLIELPVVGRTKTFYIFEEEHDREDVLGPSDIAFVLQSIIQALYEKLPTELFQQHRGFINTNFFSIYGMYFRDFDSIAGFMHDYLDGLIQKLWDYVLNDQEIEEDEKEPEEDEEQTQATVPAEARDAESEKRDDDVGETESEETSQSLQQQVFEAFSVAGLDYNQELQRQIHAIENVLAQSYGVQLSDFPRDIQQTLRQTIIDDFNNLIDNNGLDTFLAEDGRFKRGMSLRMLLARIQHNPEIANALQQMKIVDKEEETIELNDELVEEEVEEVMTLSEKLEDLQDNSPASVHPQRVINLATTQTTQEIEQQLKSAEQTPEAVNETQSTASQIEAEQAMAVKKKIVKQVMENQMTKRFAMQMAGFEDGYTPTDEELFDRLFQNDLFTANPLDFTDQLTQAQQAVLQIQESLTTDVGNLLQAEGLGVDSRFLQDQNVAQLMILKHSREQRRQFLENVYRQSTAQPTSYPDTTASGASQTLPMAEPRPVFQTRHPLTSVYSPTSTLWRMGSRLPIVGNWIAGFAPASVTIGYQGDGGVSYGPPSSGMQALRLGQAPPGWQGGTGDGNTDPGGVGKTMQRGMRLANMGKKALNLFKKAKTALSAGKLAALLAGGGAPLAIIIVIVVLVILVILALVTVLAAAQPDSGTGGAIFSGSGSTVPNLPSTGIGPTCWPTTYGSITQEPYVLGCEQPKGRSHCDPSSIGYTPDAYDLGIAIGTPIYALDNGIIYYKGIDQSDGGGYGLYMIIDHGTYYAYYAHLSKVIISTGSVQKGQQVALSGNTGWSTGPHLHFEIRVKAEGEHVGGGGTGKTSNLKGLLGGIPISSETSCARFFNP